MDDDSIEVDPVAGAVLSAIHQFRVGGAEFASNIPLAENADPVMDTERQYSSQGEALWFGLGRRIQFPAWNQNDEEGKTLRYRPFDLTDVAALGFRFVLMNPKTSPGVLEQIAFAASADDPIFGSAPNHPQRSGNGGSDAETWTTYAPRDEAEKSDPQRVLDRWFEDNFDFDSDQNYEITESDYVRPDGTRRSVRPLLTAHSPTSNLVGKRMFDRDWHLRPFANNNFPNFKSVLNDGRNTLNAPINPAMLSYRIEGEWDPSRQYLAGMVVYDGDQAWVARRDVRGGDSPTERWENLLEARSTSSRVAAQAATPWEPQHFQEYPGKVNPNTATFQELWRTYSEVIYANSEHFQTADGRTVDSLPRMLRSPLRAPPLWPTLPGGVLVKPEDPRGSLTPKDNVVNDSMLKDPHSRLFPRRNLVEYNTQIDIKDDLGQSIFGPVTVAEHNINPLYPEVPHGKDPPIEGDNDYEERVLGTELDDLSRYPLDVNDQVYPRPDPIMWRQAGGRVPFYFQYAATVLRDEPDFRDKRVHPILVNPNFWPTIPKWDRSNTSTLFTDWFEPRLGDARYQDSSLPYEFADTPQLASDMQTPTSGNSIYGRNWDALFSMKYTNDHWGPDDRLWDPLFNWDAVHPNPATVPNQFKNRNHLSPGQMLQLRAAIMAVNTIDMRDSDSDVTARTVLLFSDPIYRLTNSSTISGDPARAGSSSTGGSPSAPVAWSKHPVPTWEATVYGNEAQLFITEVLVHRTSDEANPYVAVELYNPYNQPVNIKGYMLARAARRHAEGQSALSTFTTYRRNGRDNSSASINEPDGWDDDGIVKRGLAFERRVGNSSTIRSHRLTPMGSLELVELALIGDRYAGTANNAFGSTLVQPGQYIVLESKRANRPSQLENHFQEAGHRVVVVEIEELEDVLGVPANAKSSNMRYNTPGGRYRWQSTESELPGELFILRTRRADGSPIEPDEIPEDEKLRGNWEATVTGNLTNIWNPYGMVPVDQFDFTGITRADTSPDNRYRYLRYARGSDGGTNPLPRNEEAVGSLAASYGYPWAQNRIPSTGWNMVYPGPYRQEVDGLGFFRYDGIIWGRYVQSGKELKFDDDTYTDYELVYRSQLDTLPRDYLEDIRTTDNQSPKLQSYVRRGDTFIEVPLVGNLGFPDGNNEFTVPDFGMTRKPWMPITWAAPYTERPVGDYFRPSQLLSFPIQVTSADWGGNRLVDTGVAASLRQPSRFPYGGFARVGDILKVPYIGAYRLRALDPDGSGAYVAAEEINASDRTDNLSEPSLASEAASSGVGQSQTLRYNELYSITMDAHYAEDPAITNDRENIGRIDDPILQTRLFRAFTVLGSASEYTINTRSEEYRAVQDDGEHSDLSDRFPGRVPKRSPNKIFNQPDVVEGQININTAPWYVLAKLPLVVNPQTGAVDQKRTVMMAKSIAKLTGNYVDPDWEPSDPNASGSLTEPPLGPKTTSPFKSLPDLYETDLNAPSRGAGIRKGVSPASNEDYPYMPPAFATGYGTLPPVPPILDYAPFEEPTSNYEKMRWRHVPKGPRWPHPLASESDWFNELLYPSDPGVTLGDSSPTLPVFKAWDDELRAIANASAASQSDRDRFYLRLLYKNAPRVEHRLDPDTTLMDRGPRWHALQFDTQAEQDAHEKQIREINFSGSREFERWYANLTRISNLVSFSSDTYTVYIVVEGWRDVGTSRAERVLQQRKAYIMDRSGITPTNLKPKIIPIPTE